MQTFSDYAMFQAGFVGSQSSFRQDTTFFSLLEDARRYGAIAAWQTALYSKWTFVCRA